MTLDARTKHCASCGASIIWLFTANLKAMPVNAAGVLLTDTQYDHTRHVSHFATCPQAAKHRRQNS